MRYIQDDRAGKAWWELGSHAALAPRSEHLDWQLVHDGPDASVRLPPLRSAAVQEAFATRGVAYLTADWTRGDPAIGALLREYGREGVPLYLYWAPGAPEPVVLPQLLTEGILLEALGAS